MNNEKTIHIGINRKRLKLIGFGYIVLALAVFVGFYFFSLQTENTWSLVLKITGGVIAVFLVITAASALQKLNDSNAGITINTDGINDKSTTISVGMISWKSIQSLEPIDHDKMILVFVKKPDDIIKNSKNRAIKQLLERNKTIFKTPVVIESTYLNCSFEELRTNLMEQYKRFGPKK